MNITTQKVDNYTKNIFLENVKRNKYNKQIKFFNLTSDHFFKNNKTMFDIIYIDGCHEPEYIKRDIDNYHKYLNINGIMWLDDYKRKHKSLKIDKFDDYKIIHKNYQLGLQKIQ